MNYGYEGNLVRHLHVWGVQVNVRAYNPREKKFDAITFSFFFHWVSLKMKRVYILLS